MAVTAVGRQHASQLVFRSATQIATANWFLGLIETLTTLADGDTMATHAGWSEFINYAAAERPVWGQDSSSGSTMANSSPVAYTITGAGGVVSGFFVVGGSAATDNDKLGTTGTLYATAGFSASQTVVATDVVNVTVTVAQSSL